MNIIETYTNHNPNNYRTANRGKNDIKWIVMHYTANPSSTAAANAQYYTTGNLNGISAHYFVDETGIYRGVREKDIAGHCGKYANAAYLTECRNDNSIGIEMCCYCVSGRKASQLTGNETDLYFADKTVTNTIELVKDIMNRYNIDASHVIRHYDVHSGRKMCPRPYIGNDINTYYKKTGNQLWNEFKAKLDADSSSVKPSKTSKSVCYIGVVHTGDSTDLNFRSFASSSSASNIKGSFHNGEYILVLKERPDGWFYVYDCDKNTYGYVFGKYLLPKHERDFSRRTVTVSEGLNIRQKSNISGSILTTMPKDAVFMLLKKLNHGWGLVWCGNMIGYCSLSNAYSKDL